MKKYKAKPFSVTIDQKINSEIRQMAEKMGTSFSDIAEKSLRYFLYHQENVLKFSQDVNEYRKERLRCLKGRGIRERTDVCYLAELTQQAYAVTPGVVDVTPEFVINLTKAFQILLKLEIKNRDELMPYFLNTFPGKELEMNDLERRIDLFLDYVKEKHKIDSRSADYVARCLVGIIRDGEFEMPPHVICSIERLLAPWVFWTAKRAINHPIADIEDIGISLNPASLMDVERKKYSLKDFQIPGFSTFGPVTVNISSFSGKIKIYFKFLDADRKIKHEINCDIAELFDLLHLVTMLDHLEMLKRPEENYAVIEQWEIGKNPDEDEYNITRYIDSVKETRSNVTIYLHRKELEDFVKVMKELVERQDIHIALQSEYIERYGAI
ncbi:MAG: hypothetical protein JRC60_07200 [Deltaproteobacteria bacterium]|nr:hypothetical protein [Deltaproteobacteria bacterium]